jgi:uroporphyrinogen-III decarboxylase
MKVETMTGWERVWVAANGEKPDRVPVVPISMGGYTAAQQGMSSGGLYRDPWKAVEAMVKTYNDVGAWDAIFTVVPFNKPFYHFVARMPMELKIPGVDLPDDYVIQFHEKEILTYDDYDKIAEWGWDKFYDEDVIFRISDYTAEDVVKGQKDTMAFIHKAIELWAQNNAESFYDFGSDVPFFHLCLGRSFLKFTEDLYYRKEKVHKALRRMTDDIITNGLGMLELTGKKLHWLVCERGSAYQYPLSIFEEFWMPYVKEIIDAWSEKGIITVFHLDTDWSKNLPSIKKNFPKNSYILELDSTTDIIAAREYMGNHCCIKGDIPATLLTLGTSEEVEAYCQKMIKEVGRDGGFIMASGCEVPMDCKSENFLAMLDSAKKSFY